MATLCGVQVLLLEAGDEEPEVAEVPGLAPLLQGSSIDWNYRTQPEEHACRSRREGGCYWARGKVMGGSSTINYMIYMRGHPEDFDEWEALGNEGWGYSEVLPYFKKSERNEDPDVLEESPEFHGQHGPQTVERFPYTDPNVPLFIEGWRHLGYDLQDLNDDTQVKPHAQRKK